MRHPIRTTLALTFLAAPAFAQPAAIYFANYYAVGDSLASGFVSGSLVTTHQVNSVPAHIARQAGITDFRLAVRTPIDAAAAGDLLHSIVSAFRASTSTT